MSWNVARAMALAAAVIAFAPPAHANTPEEGLQCPAGSTPEFSAGNTVLKCKLPGKWKRESICPPVVFKTLIPSFTGNVVMEPGGSDQCLAVGAGRRTPSVMSPRLPSMPEDREFSRVVSASGPDHFEADRYVFPAGVPLAGNPSKGVHCPTGFDGAVRFEGKGLRCSKVVRESVEADCDIGWTLRPDDRGTQDRCLGPNDGPTKPKGITFAQFQAENALPSTRWSLLQNVGPDRWRKYQFSYPLPSLL